MELTRGGNADLDGNELMISWATQPGGADIDVSIYLLGGDGKVRGDADMVFFNQLDVPGVTMRPGQRQATISLTPDRLDPTVQRIAICMAIDATNDRAARLADAGSISAVNGGTRFTADIGDATEAALIVAEVYRRNDRWKLRAVAQGFNGGLAALARSFGVEVADEQPAAPPPPINLTKVTLEKAGKINLRKGGGAIRALLQWEGEEADGFGDLDFYCFYVMSDGTIGKVYWKDHGKADSPPFITLSGDAQSAGSEEIILHRPEALKYALFAAYSAISNGEGSFLSYRPRMIMTDREGSEVTIPLLHPDDTSYWVAITHVAVEDGITIQHVETYGLPDDEAAPLLYADGSWEVSVGEIEFKDDDDDLP